MKKNFLFILVIFIIGMAWGQSPVVKAGAAVAQTVKGINNFNNSIEQSINKLKSQSIDLAASRAPVIATPTPTPLPERLTSNLPKKPDFSSPSLLRQSISRYNVVKDRHNGKHPRLSP